MALLVCQGCRNEYHKLSGLDKETYYFTVLETRSPRSVSAEPCFLSRHQGRICSRAVSQLLIVPWLVEISCNLQVAFSLYVSLSRFLLFMRIQSCWIRARPNDLILSSSSAKTLFQVKSRVFIGAGSRYFHIFWGNSIQPITIALKTTKAMRLVKTILIQLAVLLQITLCRERLITWLKRAPRECLFVLAVFQQSCLFVFPFFSKVVHKANFCNKNLLCSFSFIKLEIHLHRRKITVN